MMYIMSISNYSRLLTKALYNFPNELPVGHWRLAVYVFEMTCPYALVSFDKSFITLDAIPQNSASHLTGK